MTTKEFSLGFDVLYDEATKGAPGVSEYEKSVFLTRAQRVVYDDLIERYGKDSEADNLLNKKIHPYIAAYDYTIDSLLSTSRTKYDNNTTSSKSIFFEVPTDLYRFGHEHVETQDDNFIQVSYLPYHKVTKTIQSPFRNSMRRKSYRVNMFTVDDNGTDRKLVEILYGFKSDPVRYNIRYFSNIKPIITIDLTSDPNYMGFNLSIDGETDITESELHESVHNKILELAVENAMLSYMENNLQNRVQIDRIQ